MTSDQRQAMGRLFDHLDGLDFCFEQLVGLNGVDKKTRQKGSGQAFKTSLEEILTDRWDNFSDDLDWCIEIGVPNDQTAYLLEQFLPREFWDKVPQPVRKFLPENSD